MKGWLLDQKASYQDFLSAIHDDYGLHQERMIATNFPGASGDQVKLKVMEIYRDGTRAPKIFGDQKVLCRLDYKKSSTGLAMCFTPDGEVLFDSQLKNPSFQIPGTELSIPTFWVALEQGAGFFLETSDYIQFVLENGSSVHIRPSGTEQVLKQYFNFELQEATILSLADSHACLASDVLYWDAQTAMCTPEALQHANPIAIQAILGTTSTLIRNQRIQAALAPGHQIIADWSRLSREEKIVFLKASGFLRKAGLQVLEKRFQEATEVTDAIIQSAQSSKI